MEGASRSSKKVPLNPPPNPFPSRVPAQTGPAVIASVRCSTGHTCTANIRLLNAASYGQGAAGRGCRGPFFRNSGAPRIRSGPTCLQELGHLASGIVGKPVPRARSLRLASALLLTVGTRRSCVRSSRNWVLDRSRPPPHTHTPMPSGWLRRFSTSTGDLRLLNSGIPGNSERGVGGLRSAPSHCSRLGEGAQQAFIPPAIFPGSLPRSNSRSVRSFFSGFLRPSVHWEEMNCV